MVVFQFPGVSSVDSGFGASFLANHFVDHLGKKFSADLIKEKSESQIFSEDLGVSERNPFYRKYKW